MQLSDKPKDHVDITTAHLGEIYDLYRCAALNKDYYGDRLAAYQRYNTTIEVMIALGTTGSGLSAVTILQTDTGKAVFGVLVLASSVLAVAKPFLQFNKSIERYSKLFTGYLDVYVSMYSLVSKIKRKRDLTEELIAEFEKSEQRYLDLSRDDDPKPNAKVAGRCEKAVRQRIPSDWLWYPEVSKVAEATLDKSDAVKGDETALQKADANQGAEVTPFPGRTT